MGWFGWILLAALVLAIFGTAVVIVVVFVAFLTDLEERLYKNLGKQIDDGIHNEVAPFCERLDVVMRTMSVAMETFEGACREFRTIHISMEDRGIRLRNAQVSTQEKIDELRKATEDVQRMLKKENHEGS